MKSLFFYGNDIGIDGNVADKNSCVEFAIGSDDNKSEKGNHEESIAEEGDYVLYLCDERGLMFGLICVDEVESHEEQLIAVEDVEDG